MENKDTLQAQHKAIGNLTDNDDLREIALDLETFKATEAIIKANPQFKDMTFMQLHESKEFQQALKEYRASNPAKPELLEDIEELKSISPKNHIKPNNKLANKITKDIISEGEFNLAVSSKNAKKEVFTKVMLDYDEKYVHFSGREKYRPYDQEVYDGVVTLFVANEALFKENKGVS